MNKHLPKMKTDEEVEKLLEHDLSDYLHPENFKQVNFEFISKENTITIPVSPQLLEALNIAAQKRGVSYDKYIQEVLEKASKKIK